MELKDFIKEYSIRSLVCCFSGGRDSALTQNTTRADLTKKTYEMEGSTLKNAYEQEVYVENLGTRTCMVYEYEGENQGMTIIYVDKETFCRYLSLMRKLFIVGLWANMLGCVLGTS